MDNIVFNRNFNTIFLDMDGVLADFDKYVIDNVGRTFDHMTGPAGDDAMWEFLKKVDHFYLQLEPTPYAFELWELAHSFGAEVEVLTALPRRAILPQAEQDKRDWIKKYFGDYDTLVRIGPYSKDKWKHCMHGDILVDDRADNIHDWTTKGEKGIGILHKYNNYPATAEKLKKAAGR